MSAPTFIGAGAPVSGVNPSTMTPPLPPGVAQDDIVLLAWVAGTGGYVSAGPTNGTWTELFRDPVGTADGSPRIMMFWKKHTTGQGNPVVTCSGMGSGDDAVAQCVAFRNIDLTTPIDVIGDAYTTTAQNIGPITGITPLTNKPLVIVVGAKHDDWTSVATLTGDTYSWTEIGEPDTTAGNDAGLVWDFGTLPSVPAPVTAKTFQVTGGAITQTRGRMFSLRAADQVVDGGVVTPENLQTLSLAGTGSLQAQGTPTDTINVIPAAISTSDISFTWTPQAGPVSYFVGSTLYTPSNANYTAIKTPITFTASVSAALASLAAEGLGQASRSQFYFTYHWDFGDGEEGYGQTVTHTYKVANPSAQVVLQVIDSQARSIFSRKQLYLKEFSFVRLSHAISVT